jgi:cytochrome c-type biogenesis protein CcmE
MTPKQSRMRWVALGVLAIGGAAALGFSALGDNLSYFRDPTDVRSGAVKPGEAFRLGGLVKRGSIIKSPDGITMRFIVTDLKNELGVSYRGLTPDLFREGQGVVAEGKLNATGIFVASLLLAKHDENYMPPEVAKSLKARDQWKPSSAQ